MLRLKKCEEFMDWLDPLAGTGTISEPFGAYSLSLYLGGSIYAIVRLFLFSVPWPHRISRYSEGAANKSTVTPRLKQ